MRTFVTGMFIGCIITWALMFWSPIPSAELRAFESLSWYETGVWVGTHKTDRKYWRAKVINSITYVNKLSSTGWADEWGK